MAVVTEKLCLEKMSFNAHAVRESFPILAQQVHEYPLAYLDNAASSQKPRPVLDAIQGFYLHDYANVHRGIHTLSERATTAYEEARTKVQKFINARDHSEVVFVRGTTEAINLVAQSFLRPRLSPDDTIVLTMMEHHSNIVPWQLLCEQTGAQIKVVNIDENGELKLDELQAQLEQSPRLLSITHISNVLGTINPLKKIIPMAHAYNVPVLVDGAQAIPHMAIDVQSLDCDFYAFSGHKMYGPTGIGVLYGKQALLVSMPPYHGGGEMIQQVSFEQTIYKLPPHKFEAGTPHIAGVIGLGVTVDYLSELGLDCIGNYEQTLLDYGHEQLAQVPGLKMIGTAKHKASILSFTLDGIHPHDIATVLDQYGIAVRAGHHCAMPLMKHLGLPATTRASLGLYNVPQEIDRMVEALNKARELFA